MKRFAKTISMLMVLCTLVVLCFVFVGCEQTPPEPVYEIRLYDDNWVELERDPGFPSCYKNSYTLKYDGKKKGFNVKCLMDGEEFYRYDYKNPIPEHIKPSPLRIWISHRTDANHTYDPIDRGKYLMNYKYDEFKKYLNYWTPSGRYVNLSEMSSDKLYQITLIIE